MCKSTFALNNQETNRGRVNVIVDERTMREIYLPPFEAAVKKLTCSLLWLPITKLQVPGVRKTEISLNRILKKEWGFNGAGCIDWGGTHSTVKAAIGGLDVEMGTSGSASLRTGIDSTQ